MTNLEINLTCKVCNGSGLMKTEIPLGELLDLLRGFHFKNQKVDAINEVRRMVFAGSIGLKPAKEIVEAVFQLFDSLDLIQQVLSIKSGGE